MWLAVVWPCVVEAPSSLSPVHSSVWCARASTGHLQEHFSLSQVSCVGPLTIQHPGVSKIAGPSLHHQYLTSDALTVSTRHFFLFIVFTSFCKLVLTHTHTLLVPGSHSGQVIHGQFKSRRLDCFRQCAGAVIVTFATSRCHDDRHMSTQPLHRAAIIWTRHSQPTTHCIPPSNSLCECVFEFETH